MCFLMGLSVGGMLPDHLRAARRAQTGATPRLADGAGGRRRGGRLHPHQLAGCRTGASLQLAHPLAAHQPAQTGFRRGGRHPSQQGCPVRLRRGALPDRDSLDRAGPVRRCVQGRWCAHLRHGLPSDHAAHHGRYSAHRCGLHGAGRAGAGPVQLARQALGGLVQGLDGARLRTAAGCCRPGAGGGAENLGQLVAGQPAQVESSDDALGQRLMHDHAQEPPLLGQPNQQQHSRGSESIA